MDISANYLSSVIFFFTTLLSGLFVVGYPQKVARHGTLLLTFGGSFLFCLTFLHLLPEVYEHMKEYPYLSYCLLLGFFFQFFLDLLSDGIAHGHTHSHKEGATLSRNVFGLFSALFIHAMFDGLLIGGHGHGHGHDHSLLAGMVLHKIPTTFALMTILVEYRYKKGAMIGYLVLFALASPLGCFLPSLLKSMDLVETGWVLYFWALAVGNLLHIATTILAEVSADHRLRMPQIIAYLAGAFLAIMANIH
ncbi:MAG: ZIP family metal transporter [Bacteroidota bacterium]